LAHRQTSKTKEGSRKQRRSDGRHCYGNQQSGREAATHCFRYPPQGRLPTCGSERARNGMQTQAGELSLRWPLLRRRRGPPPRGGRRGDLEWE
jgi:hypothetical protein